MGTSISQQIQETKSEADVQYDGTTNTEPSKPADYRRIVADFTDASGSTVYRQIQPSYPQKPKAVQNLINGLRPLLSFTSKATDVPTFGVNNWQLDERGNAIHRHLSLKTSDEFKTIRKLIDTEAEVAHHDPHICIRDRHITITCTTHSPAGLSMKDVKLARKIDGILEPIDVLVADDQSEIAVETERRECREQNVKELDRTISDCGCGP